MSTSRTIYAVKEPDDKHKKMAAVHAACTEAGMDPPNEVEDYFNGYPPSPGETVKVGDVDMVGDDKDHEAVTRVSDDYRNITDIDLRMLPDDVYMIRIVISS